MFRKLSTMARGDRPASPTNPLDPATPTAETATSAISVSPVTSRDGSAGPAECTDPVDPVFAAYETVIVDAEDVRGALRAHDSFKEHAAASGGLVTHRAVGLKLSQRLRNVELECRILEGAIARRFREGRASLVGGKNNIDTD